MPLPWENMAIPSSGDPEQDAKAWESIRRTERNEAEGLCPNGCAPIIHDDATNRHCPVCGFVGQRFSIRADQV